jgi:hypothetical protein
VARVIVDGSVHSLIESERPTSFALGNDPYVALSGPFLLSEPSEAHGDPDDGRVSLDFSVLGLTPGATLTLQVVAIPLIDRAVYDPVAPSFAPSAALDWSLPDTPPELRALTTRVPGGSSQAASN